VATFLLARRYLFLIRFGRRQNGEISTVGEKKTKRKICTEDGRSVDLEGEKIFPFLKGAKQLNGFYEMNVYNNKI
jgi:hypothetical protein